MLLGERQGNHRAQLRAVVRAAESKVLDTTVADCQGIRVPGAHEPQPHHHHIPHLCLIFDQHICVAHDLPAGEFAVLVVHAGPHGVSPEDAVAIVYQGACHCMEPMSVAATMTVFSKVLIHHVRSGEVRCGLVWWSLFWWTVVGWGGVGCSVVHFGVGDVRRNEPCRSHAKC